MMAKRKMGVLSQYPTAAVTVLSIIGCGLWRAKFFLLSNLSTLWVLIAVEQVWDMDCPRFEHGVTANPIDVE